MSWDSGSEPEPIFRGMTLSVNVYHHIVGSILIILSPKNPIKLNKKTHKTP